MNGHANGSIHGSASRSPKSRTEKPRRTYVGWALDKGTKALVWAALATIVFRCPSSPQALTDTSPALCKPYMQARDFVVPYGKPYYEQYLAPYVSKAQPYVDRFHEQVYKPGLASYEKHGAPRVAQAQKLSQEQWQRTIKPQLEVLQKQAGKQYDASLAPHVKKAQEVVQPYYDSAKTSATDLWELEVRPVYQRTAPYAQKLYSQGQDFALHTALPHAQHASNITWSFWKRHIWPRIRVLYGENVEPQLMRITERLGRYKDGKKLEADIKSMEASSKLHEASASAESIGSSLSSTIIQATNDPSSAASAAASSTPTVDPVAQFHEELKSWEQINAKAVDEGSEDLADRIKDITTHQIKSQADGVGNALVLQLEETAESAISGIKSRIQRRARETPSDAGDAQLEEANEDILQAIRSAGQSVKHRAQAIRDWHQNYQTETDDLVFKALQSTLETIDGIRELRLSEIGRKYASSSLPHKEWSKYNDLKKATQSWREDVKTAATVNPGIKAAKEAGDDVEHRGMAIAEDVAQELGRLRDVGKWKVAARDDTDDFSTKIIPPAAERIRQQVVEKVAEASDAAFGSESKGTLEEVTSAASEQASKLASSASEAVQAASVDKVASAASVKVSQASSAVSDAIVGSSTGSVESVASAISNKASSAASDASEAVLGSSTGSVESISSKVIESAQSVASAASESILGSESSLSDTLAAAASKASEAIIGTPSGLSDSATDAASKISDSVRSLSSAISSGVAEQASSKTLNPKMASILAAQKSGQEDVTERVGNAAKSASASAESLVGEAASSASSLASDISSKASSAATARSKSVSSAGEKASKKVFAGAMAQILVEAREPILDDVEDATNSFSERLQAMLSAAGDQASALTQAVEEALKQATSTQGTVESVTSLASEQYESAIAAASSALFGSKGNVEKGTSFAKEQYSSAVTAASYAIYGSPAQHSLAAQASSVYSNAVKEASKTLALIKSEVAKHISGPTPPVYQNILDNAEAVYSNVVATASSSLRSAMVFPTIEAREAIPSIASSRLAAALSIASAQYQSAKVAVGVEPTPVHQQYLASAQQAYYAALGLAHDQYTQFMDAASNAVNPKPTDPVEAALHAARNTYSAAMAAASANLSVLLSSVSLAVGPSSQEAPASIRSSLSSRYRDVVAAASSQLAEASSQVSQAVLGAYSDIVRPNVGTTPLASQASQNWEALVSKASEQIYGAPPPMTAVVAQQAGEYAAQASQAAAAQYNAVQSLFSELISGKEPAFTESVMARLQSAYSTGAPAFASSASSYASAAYASAASAVSGAFIPPTQVPGIFEQLTSQLNAAVDAASKQAYGSSKGTLQQASEAAASAYSDASSAVSEAVYGHSTGLAEAAQSSVVDIGASASSAISAALYGSSGNVEAASSAAGSVYSSLSSQAAEHASVVSASVSRVIYGEEQSYVESVQSQLSVAVASASSRVAAFGTQASAAVQDTVSAAQKIAEDAASSVSSVASKASSRVKDEL